MSSPAWPQSLKQNRDPKPVIQPNWKAKNPGRHVAAVAGEERLSSRRESRQKPQSAARRLSLKQNREQAIGNRPGAASPRGEVAGAAPHNRIKKAESRFQRRNLSPAKPTKAPRSSVSPTKTSPRRPEISSKMQ